MESTKVAARTGVVKSATAAGSAPASFLVITPRTPQMYTTASRMKRAASTPPVLLKGVSRASNQEER